MAPLAVIQFGLLATAAWAVWAGSLTTPVFSTAARVAAPAPAQKERRVGPKRSSRSTSEAVRQAKSIMVIVGFALPPDGKHAVLMTLRLGIRNVLRSRSTTPSVGLRPIRIEPQGW